MCPYPCVYVCPRPLPNPSFSQAIFLGAGLMAILSGLLGNVLVSGRAGGWMGGRVGAGWGGLGAAAFGGCGVARMRVRAVAGAGAEQRLDVCTPHVSLPGLNGSVGGSWRVGARQLIMSVTSCPNILATQPNPRHTTHPPAPQVEDLRMGPVAPFDAAIVVMLCGGALVAATWPENYGDAASRRSVLAQLGQGLAAIRTGGRVGRGGKRWELGRDGRGL